MAAYIVSLKQPVTYFKMYHIRSCVGASVIISFAWKTLLIIRNLNVTLYIERTSWIILHKRVIYLPF